MGGEEKDEAVQLSNEHFSPVGLSKMLQNLDGVGKRHEVSEFIRYHVHHEGVILQVWKREVLKAPSEVLPQLLFLGGDVMMMCCKETPSLAAGVGRLLPRLIATLLHQTPADKAQILHTALYNLVRKLSTNEYIPKEWVTNIQNALHNKVEVTEYGWVHEGLGEVDRLWVSARSCYAKATKEREKLKAFHKKMRDFQIDKSSANLEHMRGLAESHLQNCETYNENIKKIREILDEKIVGYTTTELEQLSAKRRKTEQLQQEPKLQQNQEGVQSSMKPAQEEVSEVEDDSMFSGDESNSEDSVKFHIGS